MTTFGTMVTRIEDEIKRSTLNSQVRQAILDAISDYEQEKEFHFNTERWSSATVDEQKFYPLPDDFVDFIGRYPLQITVNQSTYPLNRRSWDYLQTIDLDAVVGKGIPFDWAYGDDQIRLYPIPQDEYGFCLYGKKSLTAITDDAASNAWTTTAERMIRARAKWKLYLDVIHQPDKAQAQKVLEIDAELRLRGLTTRRSSSGTLRAYYH